MRKIYPIALSQRLLEARHSAGLNQKQLSARLREDGTNVSIMLISSIEQQVNLDLDRMEPTIKIIGDLLKFSIPYLGEDENEAGESKPNGEDHVSTTIDLDDFTTEQLAALHERIGIELAQRRDREIYNIRFDIQKRAASLGLSVEELLGAPVNGHKASRPNSPPKRVYRSPEGDIWTGRGPTPRWLRTYIEAGKKKEDFLVDA